MPSRPPALRIFAALSAPPSSVSLWPSITSCDKPNSGPRIDAGVLEVQGGYDGRVTLKKQIESLVVHERSMLERVVAGAQGVLDALGRPAVASDLHAVIMGRGDDGVHFVEGHAECVVIIARRAPPRRRSDRS